MRSVLAISTAIALFASSTLATQNADFEPVSFAAEEAALSAPLTDSFVTFRWKGDSSIAKESFELNLENGARIQVTDFKNRGDMFEIFDNGQSLGMTTKVDSVKDDEVFAATPEEALKDDRFSKGIFDLSKGPHKITIKATGPYEAGTAAIRVLDHANVAFHKKNKHDDDDDEHKKKSHKEDDDDDDDDDDEHKKKSHKEDDDDDDDEDHKKKWHKDDDDDEEEGHKKKWHKDDEDDEEEGHKKKWHKDDDDDEEEGHKKKWHKDDDDDEEEGHKKKWHKDDDDDEEVGHKEKWHKDDGDEEEGHKEKWHKDNDDEEEGHKEKWHKDNDDDFRRHKGEKKPTDEEIDFSHTLTFTKIKWVKPTPGPFEHEEEREGHSEEEMIF